MSGFWHGKLKRKDLEEVYDDFAEISLSSNSRKIRRLDAELPPIMEEGEPTTSTLSFNQQFPEEIISASDSHMPNVGCVRSVVSQARPTASSNNDQRALVLYKPVEMPLFLSSNATNLSLKIHPGFVDGLKNHVFMPRNKKYDEKGKERGADDSLLAVIPWVPSQLSSTDRASGGSESESKLSEEPMEAEDGNVTSMEIEEDSSRDLASTSVGNENFQQQQQQQQHCMAAQFPPNTSSSIMWSW